MKLLEYKSSRELDDGRYLHVYALHCAPIDICHRLYLMKNLNIHSAYVMLSKERIDITNYAALKALSSEISFCTFSVTYLKKPLGISVSFQHNDVHICAYTQRLIASIIGEVENYAT